MADPTRDMVQVLELAEAGSNLFGGHGDDVRGVEAKQAYQARLHAIDCCRRAGLVAGNALTEKGRFTLAGVRP